VSALLRAQWVVPIVSPPVPDGAVVVENGLIADVGPAHLLSRRHHRAQHIDLGRAAIFPGLINAHTHLELTSLGNMPCPAGGLPEWIIELRRRRNEAQKPGFAAEAVRMGVEQCLRFGVTAVGDVSLYCNETRAALAASPLRAVSFGEVLALGPACAHTDDQIRNALDAAHASSRLRIGIGPHAPYTVKPEVYRRCLRLAGEHGAMLATHLAETPFEREFLAGHSGPLRVMWERISTFDSRGLEPFAGGPIRYAGALGLLDERVLLAHVNCCDDGELEVLARGRASVVWCPRTHRYFGHRPHRWRDMLAAGINVALGTDSCASAPDLNVLADLRLVHASAGDVAPAMLWEMVTVRAARALGMEKAGFLAPGALADLAVFPSGGADPLRDVLEEQSLPVQVWIDGARVR